MSRPPSARMPITALTFDFWNTLYSADGGTMDKPRPPTAAGSSASMLGLGRRPPVRRRAAEAYRSGFDAYMAAWTGGAISAPASRALSSSSTSPSIADAVDDEPDRADRPRDRERLALGALQLAARCAPRPSPPGRRRLPPWASSPTPASRPGGICGSSWRRTGCWSTSRRLTFSDETGYPKPDRRMFETHPGGLGAEPGRGGPRGRHAPHRHRRGEGDGHGRHPLRRRGRPPGTARGRLRHPRPSGDTGHPRAAGSGRETA